MAASNSWVLSKYIEEDLIKTIFPLYGYLFVAKNFSRVLLIKRQKSCARR